MRKLIKNIFTRKVNHEKVVLTELIEGDAPAVEPGERTLIGNVLDLRHITACDVMIPRADIMAVPDTISGHDMVETFIKTRVARVAVFSETLDHLIGVLNIKDALQWTRHLPRFDITQWIQEVLFISPAMSTLDLLLMMRGTGRKTAIVVDEHGGVDGMITFARLIEEIIGDIQEAHISAPQDGILLKSDDSLVVDARSTLEELDEFIGNGSRIAETMDDIDTVGGWVTVIAGRVPVRGELLHHPNGAEFEVLDADPRRIKRVCLRNWKTLAPFKSEHHDPLS